MILVNGTYCIIENAVNPFVLYASFDFCTFNVAHRLVEKVVHSNSGVAVEALGNSCPELLCKSAVFFTAIALFVKLCTLEGASAVGSVTL